MKTLNSIKNLRKLLKSLLVLFGVNRSSYKWYNAKTDLPECGNTNWSQDVLTVNTHGGYKVLAYNFNTHNWTTGVSNVENIIYWCEMPDYPRLP